MREHLKDLAEQINARWAHLDDTSVGRQEYRVRMVTIGGLLSEAKAECGEEYPAWLEENFPGNAGLAREFLQLYEASHALREVEEFRDDDSHLTEQGIASREVLRKEIEEIEEIDRDGDAVWQEHTPD